MNVSPTWAVDTPSTLNFPSSGGTYNFGAKAVDPQPWDTLYFTIVGTVPLGYSLNSSSGVLTVLNGAPDANLIIRVSDSEFAYADHLVGVTVADVVNPGAATFAVTTSAPAYPIKTLAPITVTIRRVSTNAIVFQQTCAYTNNVNTQLTISRTGIGAVAGDIIEFAGGTYPPLKMSGFNVGSRNNRITFRNKAGEVACLRRIGRTSLTDRGFVWPWENCKWVTIDGSNGFPPWNKTLASGNYGFLCTFAAAATLANPDRGCSSFLKLAATEPTPGNYTKTDEFIIKRVEFVGGSLSGYQPILTYSGGISTNMSIPRSTGWWQENIEITECFAHDGCGNLCYVGSNWVAQDIPLRGVWIHHNRSEDTIEDGFTCKSWYDHSPTAGLPENAVHDNYVYRTGWGTDKDTNQRNGFSLFWCKARVYNNRVEGAGNGLTPDPGFSGAPANGIGIGYPGNATLPGPPKNYVYNGFAVGNHLCRIYNNISVNNDEKGIVIVGDGTAIVVEGYVFQNTVVGNGDDGISIDSDSAQGSCRNNISLGNGTNGAVNITCNWDSDNLVGNTPSAFLNADYTLKGAQPIAANSVLDISKANTDFTGALRDASPDKGAYDF